MTTLVRAPRPAAHPPLNRRTDVDLLALTRSGNRDAFAELYRRHEHDVRRYARRLVGPDEVDDVIADSFTKVLRALRNGRGPVDHPERYLMVTVRTTAITGHTRRQQRAELDRKMAVETQTSTEFDLGDDRLVEAFRSLTARWRQVIWWTEVEGRRPAEVAELLDLSPEAVSALAYRARRALRTAYDLLGVPEDTVSRVS